MSRNFRGACRRWTGLWSGLEIRANCLNDACPAKEGGAQEYKCIFSHSFVLTLEIRLDHAALFAQPVLKRHILRLERLRHVLYPALSLASSFRFLQAISQHVLKLQVHDQIRASLSQSRRHIGASRHFCPATSLHQLLLFPRAFRYEYGLLRSSVGS